MSINGNEKVAKSCNQYMCEKCTYITVRKSSYDKHLTTSKHLSAINGNEKVAKVAKSCIHFVCENCNYETSRKSSYDKHLLTSKHLLTMNNNAKVAKSCNQYVCENCNKKYKDTSGLWKHNKTCHSNNKSENIDKDQLIMMLLKQNSELIKETTEFKTLMMEVIKNGTHNTIHTNSHNKSFNLQFFLNETCKNAMNLTEFIDSIQLQLSDLERVGKLGYVEGISEIIVKSLNDLDITQRPIHCTDKKRETLYIKDENIWEKEDEQNSKIRKGIRRVARKNSSLLKDFREKNPEYKNSQSKVSDKYNTIVIEAMGGNGDNDQVKEDKIIKNISKVVSIEKDSVILV
jgi:hypothetical protein